MSKITNEGLTQSGTVWQQWASSQAGRQEAVVQIESVVMISRDV